ncbi:elongation factor 1-delta isoform X4 [Brachionus plicatilis]|uniref:Elongation factor 1-delta isoform X4 n=1 Tax=Brachionus plicatilis TaxID=10195 RepID=A0A3M7SD95_BRAPC|nr:elongation factor 1-delta isoform X4 [Brachionus plicatilis]
MKGHLLLNESVFLNRSLYEETERHFSLRTAVDTTTSSNVISSEINKIRDQINAGISGDSVQVNELINRLNQVELENKQLKSTLERLESRLVQLEGGKPVAPAPVKPAPTKPDTKPAAQNDDDFDLFGDDDEDDEEKKRITEERLKAYNEKKSKKPALVAKSSILLDVKVWDDTTDMVALEKAVRSVEMDGLVWGTSKLVPVAFGVKKLQIQCVIEDDKVSTDVLEEKICEFEDFVQSVDIAAFNKI